MGIKLSTMQGQTKETSFDFDGDEVEFCYRPNFLTPAMEDRMEDDDYDFVKETVVSALVWWDVLDDKGKRLDVNAENAALLPSRFIRALWAKVREEMAPPESSSSAAG